MEYARNMAQQPIYLIMRNLSHKIQRLQIRPKGMMVGLIFIYKKEIFEIKMMIYNQIMGVITNSKSNYHVLCKII